jgi:hypothetical protein
MSCNNGLCSPNLLTPDAAKEANGKFSPIHFHAVITTTSAAELENRALVSSEGGRVEVWRGGLGVGLLPYQGFPVCGAISACHAPFPHPAHRTRRADFPHRALRLASPTRTRRPVVVSVVTPRTSQSSRVSRVPSVTAESLDGVDRLGQSPDSWSLPVTCQKSGSFPPPALPGLVGHTNLSVTPDGPACSSRSSG